MLAHLRIRRFAQSAFRRETLGMARECAIAALRTGLWLALLGAVAWKIWPSRAAAADDANVVGFVLTVSGDWTLEGDPPRAIKGGDRLPPTAEN